MSSIISERIEELLGDPGNVVDQVSLNVDYQIIEHFSQHLYDSPNKAVEELVANGFDAFATEVLVFTPGPYTTGRLLVWDDGESMNVKGLKELWEIAKSPKSGERVEERNGKERKIIGKFGIGKLASYAVGEIISHVCRHQGEFYLVSIDYATVRGRQPVQAPIMRLPEDRAVELVKSLFSELPPSADRMLQRDSWTLAVVEKLKVADLPSGRLTWVLGNGMPLRPDFAIRVNEKAVRSRLEKNAEVNWDFGARPVVDAIKSRWKDAEKDGSVSSSVMFGHRIGLDPGAPSTDVPFVQFPRLGHVWGHVRLFDETLLKFRTKEHGRSHGFFLIVRGRLVNPDDEKLFILDPSFQTFYRSQFILFVDDLDEALLADRQRLRLDEQVQQELKTLQEALSGIARTTVEERDKRRDDEQSTRSMLPTGSRIHYREPINALLLRAPVEEVADFDPAAVIVERKDIGDDDPISIMAFKENAFHVNTRHPYYSVIRKRAGESRAAREFLRTFDLFAISERLLEGHLLTIGISEDEIKEIIGWREGLFRRLAASYEDTPELIGQMHTTSYVGGRSFEKALCAVLEDMGFSVKHDGRSGRKDAFVVATVGPESYSFTVEAKGSSGDIDNAAADVGAAANHRDRAGAEHALIIARKFSGFAAKPDRDPALMGECRSTGRVSIMDLESLEKIHTSVSRFSYPLPLLKDVFVTLESPRDKLTKIDGLVKPVEGFAGITGPCRSILTRPRTLARLPATNHASADGREASCPSRPNQAGSDLRSAYRESIRRPLPRMFWTPSMHHGRESNAAFEETIAPSEGRFGRRRYGRRRRLPRASDDGHRKRDLLINPRLRDAAESKTSLRTIMDESAVRHNAAA